MNIYQTKCWQCQGLTSRNYAKKHNGKCKACVEGTEPIFNDTPTRNERILEHGYQAYALEEDHDGYSDR